MSMARARRTVSHPVDHPHQMVFVVLENSTNKLSQNMWCHLVVTIEMEIERYAWLMHGRWFTEPSSMKQSACWGFELFTDKVEDLKAELRLARSSYDPEGMFWVVTAGPSEELLPAFKNPS
jgi:hypothetical protein